MKQIIKNFLIIPLLLLGFSINLEGQTIVWKETPKGSDVKAYTDYTEWNAEDKKYWTDYCVDGWDYCGATLIDSASYLYNCHGWAWHMTEGGAQSGDSLKIFDSWDDEYWTDENESYMSTTEAYASKISYYEDDHSAIQTSTQGIYRSKWGIGGALMEHARDCGPDGYEMEYRNYYKLHPLVTGSSDILCANQQRTYSSDIEITGSTYYWTRNESLLDYVSGQGTTDYRVEVKSNASGNAWVRIQITTPSGEVAISPKKYFWVGVPDPTIDGNEYPECFMREWYFLEPDDKWGTYYWHTDYKLRVIGSPYGYKAQIEPLEEGNGQIFCNVTNACGTGYGRLVVYISCWGFRMSPNPADDYVEISRDESKMVENNIDEYEVRIYNGMNKMVYNVKTSKPTLQINTRQFINGVYYVHFIFNGKLQVEQLVISH